MNLRLIITMYSSVNPNIAVCRSSGILAEFPPTPAANANG